MTKYAFLKPLNELSLQEYRLSKLSGMFWVWYPEATGCADEDLDAVDVDLQYIPNDLSGDYLGQIECGECRVRIFYDIIDEEAEYDW